MRNTPAGFSCVHYAMVKRLVPQYCVQHDLGAAPMTLENRDDGVTVRVGPCNLSALVEFHAPPRAAAADDLEPSNWCVGWVQSVESGAVIYEYAGPRGTTVRAALGPERTPIRDGDGGEPFYEQNANVRKPFARPPRDADEAAMEDVYLRPLVPTPADVMPFLTGPHIRFVTMQDSPGPGKLPLKLTCRSTADPRALVGKTYALGWVDPLEPCRDAGSATLRHIGGSLQFKTWLVMYFQPKREMHALHLFEWAARVDLTIHGPLFTKGGQSGSRLIRDTPFQAELPAAMTQGLSANDTACVKFLPLR